MMMCNCVSIRNMLLKHVTCPISQAKEERNAMELKYQNELTAHVKLSSLYKVNDDDNNNYRLLNPVSR